MSFEVSSGSLRVRALTCRKGGGGGHAVESEAPQMRLLGAHAGGRSV
jgi:hypothetical protein